MSYLVVIFYHIPSNYGKIIFAFFKEEGYDAENFVEVDFLLKLDFLVTFLKAVLKKNINYG